MGVRGLQTYLEKYCPSASQYVSIVELLKRHTVNGEIVIVVDGSSCIRILYDDLEWIGGGQLQQFGERAQDFVNAFKEIGVRLVFFFDGPTEGRKRRTWVERRLKSYKSVEHVLDSISRGVRSHEINRDYHFLLPPGMGQLCRVVFEIVCGCEVYQSLSECDEEIADYAKRHGAFAILGQDTDFVILDKGEALYLSMQHLDLATMKTRLYDPVQLAKCLGIQLSQLPLLATFMGNDVIPFDDLKRFHNILLQKKPNNHFMDFGKLFPSVANYIKTLPTSESLLLPELPKISQKVLGTPSRHGDILTSIRSYRSLRMRDYDREDRDNVRIDRKWADLVKEARQMHRTNKMPGMIYAIMTGLPFESSTIMEDYRKFDLPFFAEVTLPIRRRLYGIILQEKPVWPGDEHTIEEWCMAGPHSLHEPKFVAAEPPSRQHPGLRALWGSDKRWTNVRWQLFVGSVSPLINIRQLRTIPPHLVIPTMIVFYIFDYLYPWEVDAVLATAALLRHYDSVMLASLPSDPMLPRGIRLSTLYMRITFVLYILLAACGYPLSLKETAPWKFFDGKLFQAKYLAAEGGASHARLCEHNVDVLEDFQLARMVVME